MHFTISLKKNNEFYLVYKKGKSVANKHLVLYALNNNKNINKLGITVSKKVGKSVIRSRVTRLIKENYRLKETRLKQGYDLVIIARDNCSTADFYDIKKSLEHLLKKQSLIL